MAARRQHRIGSAFGAIYALRDEAFDELGLPPLYDGAEIDISSAPLVAISATGLATVTCRPIPAPRVSIDASGLATVSCANG